MFKRIISVTIAIAMVLALGMAYAQAEMTAQKYTSKMAADTQAIKNALYDSGAWKAWDDDFPATTDIVKYNEYGDISLTVGTILMTANAPLSMIPFMQDVWAQDDAYMAIKDPYALITAMQAGGCHMVLCDWDTGTDYYLYMGSDMLSATISDIDDLPAEALEGLALAVDDLDTAANVYATKLGGKAFLVYDYRASGLQLVIYTSVKNSTCIDFLISPRGNEIVANDIATLEAFLTGMQITVQ